jgi:hypothetical protein
MLMAILFLINTPVNAAAELAALIRVEELRFDVAIESVPKGLDAECRLRRDRQPPRQNSAAEPIEHDGQIDEAMCHWDVGDVHHTHLVWLRDLHRAQQIRVDLVARLPRGRARTAIERPIPIRFIGVFT